MAIGPIQPGSGVGAGVVVGALEAGGLSDDVELVGLVVGHGLATDVVMVTIVGLGLGEAVTLGTPPGWDSYAEVAQALVIPVGTVRSRTPGLACPGSAAS